MTKGDEVTFRDSEAVPRRFRKACLAVAEEVAADLVERRGDLPAMGEQLNLRARGVALGAADRAILPHQHKRVVMRIQVKAPR